MSKKVVYILTIFFVSMLFFQLAAPTPIHSQEETSPEPSPTQNPEVVVPTVEPSSQPESALEPAVEEPANSYTDWFMQLFLGDPGQDSDPTHSEQFENTPTSDDPALLTDPEAEILTQPGEPAYNPPPTPLLKMRRFDKEIIIDPKADHSCEVETLRVDLTDQTFAFRKLFLEMFAGKSYNVEIGSLPDGIDVVFGESDIHLLHLDTPITETTLEISREPGARKGDFSVPIIFIEREQEDSMYICQLNIVNR